MGLYTEGSTYPVTYAPGSVTADMSAITTPLSASEQALFVTQRGYRTVLWMVEMPSGVTSYDVTIYALGGKVTDTDAPLVIDQTQNNVTESSQFATRASNPTALRIHDIVGTPASAFKVRYQFIND